MLSPELEQQVNQALDILRRDGVVAYPTDTLYGLGAAGFSLMGVGRVFEIKGRPYSMALPLLLADTQDISQVAVGVPEIAYTLAKRFWPGPLTLVLKRHPMVPYLVTANKETIGVRVPDHPVPRALARGLGAPITGTSANRTGGPDARTADEVRAALGSDVDYIIDGGPVQLGRPSTVLDLTGPAPRFLRRGAPEVVDGIVRFLKEIRATTT